MGRAARNPDGPLGWGDPGALRRADRDHAGRRIKQLPAAMLMLGQFEGGRIIIADADHGPGHMLMIVGVALVHHCPDRKRD